MNTKSMTNVTFATLAACAVGCGIQPETLESLRDAINTVSSQAPTAAKMGPEGDSIKITFDPPHPERVDPFSFPTGAPVADQRGTTITTAAQVEVMGFAEVDEPRVFLRTKEMTKSLKVGDMTDGVEVVAIKAPQVELRMGTLVWTASMFDNTSVGKN